MPELSKNIQAEPYIELKTSAGILIVTGVIERQMIKYGERAYRFMLQESGCVGQNVSLVAETLGMSTCWVGGYLDDEINRFIGIDGVFETVNNVIIFGGKVKNHS